MTTSYSKACDSSRRITDLALAMGKFSKAKRCAEDLIDYTSSRKDGEAFVKHARALLVSVCLQGYEKKMESNPDENSKLLSICIDQIDMVKQINKEHPDNTSEAEVLMLEAKCFAVRGQLEEAKKLYQKCVDLCIKTDQLSIIHRVYYEMACYAEGNFLLFKINNLR